MLAMTKSIRPKPTIFPTLEISCPLCKQPFSQPDEVLFTAKLPDQLDSKLYSARRLPDRFHYQLVKCRHDGLVRSTPVYPPDVVAKLYKASQVTYDHEVPYLTQTYLAALQPVLVNLKFDAPILEIGSGSGFMIQAVMDQGFNQAFGIEPSQSVIAAATPQLKPRIWSGLATPKLLAKKKWQLIFLFQTFDHLAQPNQFLEMCYQALEPGGYLISFHHDLSAGPVKLLGERHPIIDLEHHFLYTPKTTAAIFETSGFIVRSLTKPANYLSMYHLVWLLPLPKIGKSLMLKILKLLPSLNFRVALKLGNQCIVAQKPKVVKKP
jgi:SAM-dependent methyltransferase